MKAFLKLSTHSIFFKEFGIVFHNLADLLLNVRTSPSVSRLKRGQTKFKELFRYSDHLCPNLIPEDRSCSLGYVH